MTKFEVGQRVTVTAHRDDNPLRFQTVRSVGKRKMVLDDGSEWLISHYSPRQWGSSSTNWYQGPSVREFRPEDVARRSFLIDLATVVNFSGWTRMEPLDLARCAEAVRQVKREDAKREAAESAKKETKI